MKALFLAPALMLAACATTGTPAPRLTGTPTAAFGETAQVGQDIRVTPLALVEDSRCPINARCVWAGRLTIRARVDYDGLSKSLEGPITLGEQRPLGVEGLNFVDAAPGKMAGQPLKASDYRFTFALGPTP